MGRNNINNLISIYEVLEEKKLDNFKKHSNYIISNKDALYIKELNIDGSILKSNLQLNSGKIIGETLNHLLTLVINETINNDTTLLLEEAKKYIKKEVNSTFSSSPQLIFPSLNKTNIRNIPLFLP